MSDRNSYKISLPFSSVTTLKLPDEKKVKEGEEEKRKKEERRKEETNATFLYLVINGLTRRV